MFHQVHEYLSEQMQALTVQAQQLGADPAAAVHDGMTKSVEGLRSLRRPLQTAARSCVQAAALSHKAAQDLIELQSGMLTAALTEMADGLERAAQARDFGALATAQSDALARSAERLANDANRALAIFTTTGRGMQELAVDTCARIAKPAEKPAPRARQARRARKPEATAA